MRNVFNKVNKEIDFLLCFNLLKGSLSVVFFNKVDKKMKIIVVWNMVLLVV